METPNVLIIDDDKDFAESIQTILNAHAFKTTLAFDGEEGLNKARKLKPDLIILDVMLPKKDGYYVLHELKEDERTSYIPVLLLTALGDTEEGKFGAEKIASGHKAESYLEKPVIPEVLLNKIVELIEYKDKGALGKEKILIIDDDPDYLAAIKMILENSDYTVLVAYSGEEGITIATHENPSLILLDVMLPHKDGYAVCKELKENEKTVFIPVVMLTSVGQKLNDPEYAKAIAITHQADDFIEKPVSSKILLKTIRSHIGPMRRLV